MNDLTNLDILIIFDFDNLLKKTILSFYYL